MCLRCYHTPLTHTELNCPESSKCYILLHVYIPSLAAMINEMKHYKMSKIPAALKQVTIISGVLFMSTWPCQWLNNLVPISSLRVSIIWTSITDSPELICSATLSEYHLKHFLILAFMGLFKPRSSGCNSSVQFAGTKTLHSANFWSTYSYQWALNPSMIRSAFWECQAVPFLDAFFAGMDWEQY